MSNKVLYTELNPQEFEKRLSTAPIAYLPLGTLEWHGRHMPLGVDGLISSGFFVELAKNIGGIVLPMLFLGTDAIKIVDDEEYYGMDIQSYYPEHPQRLVGSAYWISDELLKQILDTILKQLKRAGFKIVVAHGHMPSTMLFNKHIDEWREDLGLELLACLEKRGIAKLGIQTDHAAANETSLMMALRPDLVNIDNLPKNKGERPLGLIGKDPRKHASSTTGKEILDLQIERMAKILKQKLKEIHPLLI